MLNLALDPNADLPLAEQIVSALRTRIEDRLLRPGARLPAIRQMAQQHGVSRFTVVEAYERLVAQGYLRALRGSGFFVAHRGATDRHAPNTLPATDEHAVDVAWLMRKALEDRPEVLKAAAGWLPPDWLEQDALRRVLRTLSRDSHTRLSCYGEPQGYRPLRAQLAVRLADLGIATTADDILLTHGATQALDLIARQLLQPGEAALVDDPGYYSFFGNLRLLGVRPIGVPRGPDGPDPAALEALIAEHRPKCFFTHSVLHNPSGGNLSAAVAHRILQIAERAGLLIVEDDTYGDLWRGPTPRLSELDQLQRVIYVGSFSKTLSANLRVGFLAATPARLRALTDYKLLTAVSSSELAERTVLELLLGGHYRRHIERLRSRLEQTSTHCQRVLERCGLAVDQTPRGGVFVWARLPGVDDASSLALTGEAAGIVLAPGKLFRPQMQPSPYLRFNVACSDDPRLERLLGEALARL